MGSSFDDGGTPAVAASVPRSLSFLCFCPFPLLILFGEAISVAVGVAGSATLAMDGSASVALGVAGHLLLFLRFRPFPLLILFGEAMLVAVGVAGFAASAMDGSASVALGVAGSASAWSLMGLLFDNGGTPAVATSVLRSLSLLRFRLFLLLPLFGELMLVVVGVAESAAVVNSSASSGLRSTASVLSLSCYSLMRPC